MQATLDIPAFLVRNPPCDRVLLGLGPGFASFFFKESSSIVQRLYQGWPRVVPELCQGLRMVVPGLGQGCAKFVQGLK